MASIISDIRIGTQERRSCKIKRNFRVYLRSGKKLTRNLRDLLNITQKMNRQFENIEDVQKKLYDFRTTKDLYFKIFNLLYVTRESA